VAKKITLTIPESLHKKLEEWRTSFNMSGIFQDALTEAIKRKEEMQQRMSEDFNIAEVIERLKKEKETWQIRNFKKGEQYGMDWAMKAHYEDLVKAVNSKIEILKKDPGYKDMFQKNLTDLNEWATAKNRDIDEASQRFMEGWQKGVLSFWGLVKDRI